jgi:RNA-splicing ligase RtcB
MDDKVFEQCANVASLPGIVSVGGVADEAPGA